MEHIIVEIIGFNQAELFLGLLEQLFPSPAFPEFVRRLTLKSKSPSGEYYKTIHKLCNIKLKNPKNAIPSLFCLSCFLPKQQKAYELNLERLP